jgi:hypothetical protein
MLEKKTHRLVNSPAVSARFLADYMAATDSVRRTIIRGCKYQATARVVQHTEAQGAVSHFLRTGSKHLDALKGRAQALRDRMADDEFERDVLDHNADFIDRFASHKHPLDLPEADLEPVGTVPVIDINGVALKAGLSFRLRRVTRTNEIRIGAACLRYAKGKALPPDTASWQAAIILGYLKASNTEAKAFPEGKLCIVIDAQRGTVYPAPGNAIQRYKYVESACATIAEQWANIPPPPNAVL